MGNEIKAYAFKQGLRKAVDAATNLYKFVGVLLQPSLTNKSFNNKQSK